MTNFVCFNIHLYCFNVYVLCFFSSYVHSALVFTFFTSTNLCLLMIFTLCQSIDFPWIVCVNICYLCCELSFSRNLKMWKSKFHLVENSKSWFVNMKTQIENGLMIFINMIWSMCFYLVWCHIYLDINILVHLS